MKSIVFLKFAAIALGVIVAPAAVQDQSIGSMIAWLIDPKHALVIAIGLLFGMLGRIAVLLHLEKPMEIIYRDAAINVLAAGVNFVIAAMITESDPPRYMLALGISAIVAASGTGILKEVIEYYKNKFKTAEQKSDN